MFYAAAYIPKKLRSKFERNHANKAAALYLDIVKTWAHTKAEWEASQSLAYDVTQWTVVQDRGGLLYCSTDFYQFMKIVEVEVRSLLNVRTITKFAGENIVPVIVGELKQKATVCRAFRLLIVYDLQTEKLSEGLLDEVLSAWVCSKAKNVVHKYIFSEKQKGRATVSKMGTPALRKTLDKH